MRRIIHKMFLVWDFDKEEKWLNEMAAKGLVLTSVGFCKYEFEDCVPGEFRIGMELLKDLPQSVEGSKYIEFVEETGAEHIGTLMRWVYFRKKTSDADFKLFSDNTSRIEHLTRIIALVAVVLAVNLYFVLYDAYMYFASSHSSAFVAAGTINLLFAAVAAFGVVRLLQKRKRLKSESEIFE